MEIERKRQRGQPGGPAAGGGGWSGGRWFRRLTGGGFWDAAKQTVFTILGIIGAVKQNNLVTLFELPA